MTARADGNQHVVNTWQIAVLATDIAQKYFWMNTVCLSQGGGGRGQRRVFKRILSLTSRLAQDKISSPRLSYHTL
jgi:hypothetical protein